MWIDRIVRGASSFPIPAHSCASKYVEELPSAPAEDPKKEFNRAEIKFQWNFFHDLENSMYNINASGSRALWVLASASYS